MNEAGLGSKYLVLAGKMLQTVICSLSGLSFPRHGRMTSPWPLSARPRCFAYHSCICCLFVDLKKIPPMPRIRPCWIMVVFLYCGLFRGMPLRDGDCWLRWRFLFEDRSGEQRDDEADGEWLDEGHRCVEERILVHDFEFIDFFGFLLNSGGRGAGVLHLLEDVGAVLVHEVRHEIVVDDFPGDDVKDARDYG